jgi:hypothetical protein
MAHISRTSFVDELVEQLGRPVHAIYDVDPPSREPARRWATGARAWTAAAADGAGWTLVLQDDAVACQNLLAGLELALDQLRAPAVVSPYLGAGRPVTIHVHRATDVADRLGHSWIRMGSLYWGVAIALPTRVVPEMLAWCSRAELRPVPYDMRISKYVREVLHWPAVYTWPSLVDHRDAPSLVSHSAPGRVAARFHRGSALDIDWDRLPSTLQVTERRPW